MKEIPDSIDLEKVSESCDRVTKYMRERMIDDQKAAEAMAYLCGFVHRIKNNIEWLESVVKITKKKREDEWPRLKKRRKVSMV